ncbi:hypothetical protein CPJCM30710_21660 [Clostridium polyendosporum]|uniref:Uncharacterized protein n=1 Tax=Clostridium polyendosporum TaxID=69208 RepID=A0A919S1K2_9CLOT|nr:hypothetical protein CPJCM30710_21660 [Clostridium polyendosporum]
MVLKYLKDYFRNYNTSPGLDEVCSKTVLFRQYGFYLYFKLKILLSVKIKS